MPCYRTSAYFTSPEDRKTTTYATAEIRYTPIDFHVGDVRQRAARVSTLQILKASFQHFTVTKLITKRQHNLLTLYKLLTTP